MTIEVHVPALPESVTDATVLSWYKKPGEAVKRDETILDLETDKVVLEVPATADGVLSETLFNEGDTVEAGQLLAIITEGSQAPAVEPAKSSAAAPVETAPDASGKDADVLTPAVRKLVKELNLDPSLISGTGKDGRILKSDEPQEPDQSESKAISESVNASIPAGQRPEQRVPMTRLRARIAERLIEAQSNAAILTNPPLFLIP